MELLKNFLITLWRDEDLVTSKNTVLGSGSGYAEKMPVFNSKIARDRL